MKDGPDAIRMIPVLPSKAHIDGALRYPDSRIDLLAAAFPSHKLNSGHYFAAFVPGYSGGAVLDFHQLPGSESAERNTINQEASGKSRGGSSDGRLRVHDRLGDLGRA